MPSLPPAAEIYGRKSPECVRTMVVSPAVDEPIGIHVRRGSGLSCDLP